MTASTTSYRTIPLTQGQSAIVDSKNFDWLNQWKWYAVWDRRTRSFYAARRGPRSESPRSNIFMHRLVMGLGQYRLDPREADHIEPGSTLDNRESNLRLASHSQNCMNRRLQRNSPSGLKGSYWCKTRRRWIARIMVNGKDKYIGSFLTKEGAHAAYCESAKLHYGEFARLA